MKAIISLAAALLLAALCTQHSAAATLQPRGFTFINHPECYYPIPSIEISFDCEVELADDAKVVISDEENTVMSAPLTTNWHYNNREVKAVFEPRLQLPKGKNYRWTVASGKIFKAGDRTVTNDEISADFYVPGDLGEATPTIDPEEKVSTLWLTNLGFRYNTGIRNNMPDASFELYREGVKVRDFAVRVVDEDNNYNKGIAVIEGDWAMRFEEDTEYTLVLPENSLCSWFRNDIYNTAAEVSFTGGYRYGIYEPEPDIRYSHCSLADNTSLTELGWVRFYYDCPLILNTGAKLLLKEENIHGDILKEVTPEYSVITEPEPDSPSPAKYCVSAYFGNVSIDPDKHYSVVIPENTLITAEGEIYTNKYQARLINDRSGIDNVITDGNTAPDNMVYNLNGTVATEMIPGRIYIRRGEKFIAD